MLDFRLETIVEVSLASVSGDFSEWFDSDNCEILFVNSSGINKSEYFDFLEGEIIVFQYKTTSYRSIITNQRVLSLKNGKIESLMLGEIKKVNKPKQFYMIDGEIKEFPLIKHVIIESNDGKTINLNAENSVSLYFIRILVSNLFFVKTKGKYYYLPNKYR
ncbi:hypothetical protein [Winogradskyella sp.]|uniref:hypothetical protein n=1 Tax=Winogradskyella sp. TaxID=1883156 RepID=UPI003BAB13F9